MSKQEGLKKTLMFFIRRSIVAFVGVCFAVMWYVSYSDVIQNPYFHKGNWALVALYIFLYYILTSFYGGFRIGSQRITDTVYSNLLSLLMVNFITYFQIALVARGFQDPSPLLVSTCMQIAVIFFWSWFVTKFYFKIFKPISLVCMYGGKYPEHIVKRFEILQDKFKVIGKIQVDNVKTINYEQLSDADGIIISKIPDEKYASVLKYCVEHELRYYLVPSIGDILLRTADIIYLSDLPLLMAKNEGLFFGQRCVKRLFDVACAVTFIVLTSPIMLLVAASIKANDGGSILYRQRRCTQHGRVFDMLKFRSMIENAEVECGARLAEKDDPRITKVGKILRKHRLDELPQLFNILWGDMSFVGPRPERPEIIKEYTKTLPEFDYRLGVKCGLTGYAQVVGKYNTTPEDKLKLDLIYIQTYSFLLDIKIILMTVKAVFSKESTEGTENSK